MRNKSFVLIVFLIAGVIFGVLGTMVFLSQKPADQQIQPPANNGGITESVFSKTDAIKLLQDQNPQFKDYPSDNLPPRSVKTEQADNGFYVAFIQEGSGRPIISATCFFVDNQKNVMSEKKYNPTVEQDSTAEFSAKTCTPGACSVENCHGLDITCGPNPPEMCTEMYALGDKCLQYAKCGVLNGTCQQIENAQFTQCKTCAQNCEKENVNDPMKAFECESKCQ